MRLEDELNNLMVEINQLSMDKAFGSISSSEAQNLMIEYNKADIDINFDYSTKENGIKRRTNYVLNEYHIMTISKIIDLKTSSMNNLNDKLLKLIKLLDNYHETSLLPEN